MQTRQGKFEMTLSVDQRYSVALLGERLKRRADRQLWPWSVERAGAAGASHRQRRVPSLVAASYAPFQCGQTKFDSDPSTSLLGSALRRPFR